MTTEAPPPEPATDTPEAEFLKAVRLHQQGQLDAAESLYRAVLGRRHTHAGSLLNLGLILKARGQLETALSLWRTSVAVNPEAYATWTAMGKVLLILGRRKAGLEAFERALAIRPGHVDALNCRGNVLAQLGRAKDALASYDEALIHEPENALIVINRANLLGTMGRGQAAIDAYREGLRLDPRNTQALGAKLYQQLQICDWSDYAETSGQIVREITAGANADLPFTLLAHCDDPGVQLACARVHIRDRFPVPHAHLWRGEIYQHDRIRVAYVSADFHNHATVQLMAGLFEGHDKERFEMAAYALGPRIEDAGRRRVRAAFPEFHDVADLSDLDIARRLRAAETDIVVDLKGFTLNCRPGIFLHRPAPVQINYLGYPGTTGGDFMDYIIADPQVIPQGAERFYSEQVIRLPHTYQVNDRSRKMDDEAPTRAEVGLPEDAFVFVSFNANYKFNPPVFDIWMRLLQQTPGSVLWLLVTNEAAIANLRAEASSRGVAPHRLVFARRAPPRHHLARHRLADLFLDTLPCNAHTTASDALWAGVPVLTCAGESLVARVAASLLKVVGLPELITESLEAYEALALDLATRPARLADIKARLAANRDSSPLFDIDLNRRYIEAAYVTAWERQQRGQPPEAFDVAP